MKKIFHLIRSTDIGGSEVIALSLAENCSTSKKNRIKSMVVELHSTRNNYSYNKKKELAIKKINLITLTNLPKRISLFIAPFALTYQILKEKPHLIHSHTDLPDFVLATSLRILGLLKITPPKIVRTIHNTKIWPTHPILGKYTESTFLDDQIVGVSKKSLEAYIDLRKKNNLPVSIRKKIILNGIKTPVRTAHNFKIDKTKLNIAFCGRLEHQKGIDILIERIPKIQERFKNKFLFHIIGSGTFYQSVYNLTKTCKDVILYDPVINISSKMHAFDFLIMPSRFEGLVLTSLEASLSRTPVIAATAPGLSETLPSGWPLTFDLENEKDLNSILEKIMNNDFDIHQLANQAFTFVNEKFSQNTMVTKYLKVYKSIND